MFLDTCNKSPHFNIFLLREIKSTSGETDERLNFDTKFIGIGQLVDK